MKKKKISFLLRSFFLKMKRRLAKFFIFFNFQKNKQQNKKQLFYIKLELKNKINQLTLIMYNKRFCYKNLIQINKWEIESNEKNENVFFLNIYNITKNVKSGLMQLNLNENYTCLKILLEDLIKEFKNDILYLKKFRKKIYLFIRFIEKQEEKYKALEKKVGQSIKNKKSKKYNADKSLNDTFFNSYYLSRKFQKTYLSNE